MGQEKIILLQCKVRKGDKTGGDEVSWGNNFAYFLSSVKCVFYDNQGLLFVVFLPWNFIKNSMLFAASVIEIKENNRTAKVEKLDNIQILAL